MQQAVPADSTAFYDTSPGKGCEISGPPIIIVRKALEDQDGQIGELSTVESMLRMAAMAACGIGEAYGLDDTTRRSIDDLRWLIYGIEERLHKLGEAINASHDVAYSNAYRMMAA